MGEEPRVEADEIWWRESGETCDRADGPGLRPITASFVFFFFRVAAILELASFFFFFGGGTEDASGFRALRLRKLRLIRADLHTATSTAIGFMGLLLPATPGRSKYGRSAVGNVVESVVSLGVHAGEALKSASVAGHRMNRHVGFS